MAASEADADKSSAKQKENGSDSEASFNGFSEEDLGDPNEAGKLVSMIKTLMKGNAQLLAGQEKMKSDLTKIQSDNVELRREVNSLNPLSADYK